MIYSYKDFNLYYEKYGNNSNTIIILPGWGDNRYSFNNLISLLKFNYSVYIFDYPGFGNSSFPDRDLDIHDYSELIYNFIIDNDIKNYSFICHSFGGRIFIDLNKNYKLDIDKVLLIDIAGIKEKKDFYLVIKEKIYKLLKKISIFIPKKKRNNYINLLINIFGSSDYSSLSDNMRNTFKNIINYDQIEDISYINIDTLIIWGEEDISVSVKSAYLLNKEIINSGLIVIPKCGHFPMLEKAYYFNSIVLEYFK